MLRVPKYSIEDIRYFSLENSREFSQLILPVSCMTTPANISENFRKISKWLQQAIQGDVENRFLKKT